MFLISSVSLLTSYTYFVLNGVDRSFLGVYLNLLLFVASFDSNLISAFLLLSWFSASLIIGADRPGRFYAVTGFLFFVCVCLLTAPVPLSSVNWAPNPHNLSTSFYVNALDGPSALHGVSFLVTMCFLIVLFLALSSTSHFVFLKCSHILTFLLGLGVFTFCSGSFWAFFSAVWGNWYNNDPVEVFYVFLFFAAVSLTHGARVSKVLAVSVLLFCFFFLVLLRWGFLNSNHSASVGVVVSGSSSSRLTAALLALLALTLFYTGGFPISNGSGVGATVSTPTTYTVPTTSFLLSTVLSALVALIALLYFVSTSSVSFSVIGKGYSTAVALLFIFTAVSLLSTGAEGLSKSSITHLLLFAPILGLFLFMWVFVLHNADTTSSSYGGWVYTSRMSLVNYSDCCLISKSYAPFLANEAPTSWFSTPGDANSGYIRNAVLAFTQNASPAPTTINNATQLSQFGDYFLCLNTEFSTSLQQVRQNSFDPLFFVSYLILRILTFVLILL